MSEILRRELHSSIHVLAGDPKPLMLMYHVTNRCNFRCIFCNWRRMAPTLYQNETPASKVKDHIKQFTDLGTVVTDFTGGEPLMRKELPEFFREAKDCGMLTSMATNGWFVRQRIDEIAPFLDMARVSLDSPVPEEHDRIRRVRRSFVRAVDAIKCFREYSVPVQGGCVLTRETLSLDRLEKLSELG